MSAQLNKKNQLYFLHTLSQLLVMTAKVLSNGYMGEGITWSGYVVSMLATAQNTCNAYLHSRRGWM